METQLCSLVQETIGLCIVEHISRSSISGAVVAVGKESSLLSCWNGCLAMNLIATAGKTDRSSLEKVIDSPCLASHVTVVVSRQIAHSAVQPL